MTIEARNRALPDWFTRIRTHQLALPRFQRDEVWSHTLVMQLFNTILKNLPVGAALVLEVGNEEPFMSRTLKGAPQSGERVTEHLLDGQQRLTALWRGLHNNYEDRTFFLTLKRSEDGNFTHQVDSRKRWKHTGDTERRPFWLNFPADVWKQHMIPLDLLRPDIEAQQAFREWARAAIPDADERDEVTDQASILRQKFASFNLPFMSLPVTTGKETALDVFIKMNTSAVSLSVYDIVVAQVEAGMRMSLREKVAEIIDACPRIQDYYSPPDLALYTSALLQGRVPSNVTYLTRDFGPRLLETWPVLLAGLDRTVELLEQERIFDAQRLPSDVVVPVLVAFWGLAPQGLDAEGRARHYLRTYMWRAFFTNRYERTTNSRALADFNEWKPLVLGSGDAAPSLLDESQFPLPQPQELIEASWPMKKGRLARALLALALRHGGLDLADGCAVTRANLAKREYHHLFPDAYLKGLGYSSDQIYRSLNCALITWQTNRTISDQDPKWYLEKRSDGALLGEQEVRERLSSHLIPYDEMIAEDYQAFLLKRAELLHEAMLKLCANG